MVNREQAEKKAEELILDHTYTIQVELIAELLMREAELQDENGRLSHSLCDQISYTNTYKTELSASQKMVEELERSLHIAEQNELSTKMQYDKVVAQGKVLDEGVAVNTDECKEKPIYKKGNWNTDRLQDIENLRTQEEGSENCC